MKRERPNPVLKPALQITDTVKPIALSRQTLGDVPHPGATVLQNLLC